MGSNVSMARYAEIIREEGTYSLSGPMPAEVVSYDRTKRRATVRFPVRMQVRDIDTGEVSFETVGEVVDVPVSHLAGGGGSLTFDLLPGDTGLVVVLERPVGEWLAEGGEDVYPLLDERFTLSGCVFLPGLSAYTRSLPSAAGRWLLDAPLIQLGAGAVEYLARADKVAERLSALEAKYNAHTHAVPISVPSTPFVGAATSLTPPTTSAVSPVTTSADVASELVLSE